jgi:porphobilinogen synthase
MAVKTASRLTLARRPRRLRRTEAIRRLVRETHLSPDCFVLPLFVCEGTGVRREVASMPGVFQLSVDEAVKEAAAARADGVSGVLLFGLPESKDAVGSLAADPEAPVQVGLRAAVRCGAYKVTTVADKVADRPPVPRAAAVHGTAAQSALGR